MWQALEENINILSIFFRTTLDLNWFKGQWGQLAFPGRGAPARHLKAAGRVFFTQKLKLCLRSRFIYQTKGIIKAKKAFASSVSISNIVTPPLDKSRLLVGAPPPNGRGLMILYAQNAIFSLFFRRSLRSRLILSIILIEIWPKHVFNCLLLQPSTLSVIVYPPPFVDKVHAPLPLRSNPLDGTQLMSRVGTHYAKNCYVVHRHKFLL